MRLILTSWMVVRSVIVLFWTVLGSNIAHRFFNYVCYCAQCLFVISFSPPILINFSLHFINSFLILIYIPSDYIFSTASVKPEDKDNSGSLRNTVHAASSVLHKFSIIINSGTILYLYSKTCLTSQGCQLLVSKNAKHERKSATVDTSLHVSRL